MQANASRSPSQDVSVSRRSVLQIGGLALGGISLPQLLQAESRNGIGRSSKSIIMIFLSGGPPHQIWSI